MSKKFSLTPFICIPFLACGGGGGGGHTVMTVDSGNGSGSGSGSAAPCTVDSALSNDFGSAADQYGEWDGSGSSAAPPGSYEEWDGVLNNDTDFIRLELFGGFGAIAGGIAPGTYSITGDDTNYATCGVCLRLFGDASQTSADDYFATSGTVVLTTVSSGSGSASGSDVVYGTISGSFQNAMFEHVTIGSDYTSTPIGDCTATLASGTFSTDVYMGSAAAAPAPSLKIHWNRPGVLTRRHK